jgi:hypothetical protein
VIGNSAKMPEVIKTMLLSTVTPISQPISSKTGNAKTQRISVISAARMNMEICTSNKEISAMTCATHFPEKTFQMENGNGFKMLLRLLKRIKK